MGKMIEVTDDTFDDEVIKSELPVLLDYWAEWCGPCKMITPLLEQIATEYDKKLKVCKINIDHNTSTSAKYNIKGIPTLMVFKNGDIEGTKVGSLTKSQLTEFLDDII